MRIVLLTIRWRQLYRMGGAIGPVRLILVLLSLALCWVFCIALCQEQKPAWLLHGIVLLLCASIHVSRQDKDFIFKHVENPNREIFFEYGFIALFFGGGAWLSGGWYMQALTLALLFGLSYLKGSLQYAEAHFRFLPKILPPAQYFEWISGFRAYGIMLLPLYLLALGLSWFNYAPLLLFGFFALGIASFYTKGEPLQVLRESRLSPQGFLLHKIALHAWALTLLYVPVFVMHTAFNPGLWWLGLLWLPLQIILLSCAICLKYHAYTPQADISQSGPIMAVSGLSAIIPFLMPLPLLATLWYFPKASKNLAQYLND